MCFSHTVNSIYEKSKLGLNKHKNNHVTLYPTLILKHKLKPHVLKLCALSKKTTNHFFKNENIVTKLTHPMVVVQDSLNVALINISSI